MDSEYEYSDPRSKDEAIKLLEKRINNNSRFVFAAVKGDYGDKLINSLDHIILVDVPKDVRNQRVRTRSFQKFGKKMRPGGNLYDKEQKWFDIVDSRLDDYRDKSPDPLRWQLITWRRDFIKIQPSRSFARQIKEELWYIARTTNW